MYQEESLGSFLFKEVHMNILIWYLIIGFAWSIVFTTMMIVKNDDLEMEHLVIIQLLWPLVILGAIASYFK